MAIVIPRSAALVSCVHTVFYMGEITHEPKPPFPNQGEATSFGGWTRWERCSAFLMLLILVHHDPPRCARG
jgi:hypothetical protein